MNLLSALSELKRIEIDDRLEDGSYGEGYGHGKDAGYNKALEDLSKYELCEEELAMLLESLSDHPEWLFLSQKAKDTYRQKAKAIIENIHLWIKRKDVK